MTRSWCHDVQEDIAGRWLLATVVALTLLNSGVSVAFSYIGRDFWTALSNKDPAQFNIMLQRSVAKRLPAIAASVVGFESKCLASGSEQISDGVASLYFVIMQHHGCIVRLRLPHHQRRGDRASSRRPVMWQFYVVHVDGPACLLRSWVLQCVIFTAGTPLLRLGGSTLAPP